MNGEMHHVELEVRERDIKYLQKHNVPQTVEDIMAKLLKEMPEDPLAFMIDEFRMEMTLRNIAAGNTDGTGRAGSPSASTTGSRGKR